MAGMMEERNKRSGKKKREIGRLADRKMIRMMSQIQLRVKTGLRRIKRRKIRGVLSVSIVISMDITHMNANKGKQKKHKDKEAYIAQEDSNYEPLTLMVTTIAESSNS